MATMRLVPIFGLILLGMLCLGGEIQCSPPMTDAFSPGPDDSLGNGGTTGNGQSPDGGGVPGGGNPPGGTNVSNEPPPGDGGLPPADTDPGSSEPAFSINPSSLRSMLMAFHACDSASADCDDPRNHQVYLATSDDGANWSVIDGWVPYQGSVPDVIERSGELYIYTPNEVTRIDLATGHVYPPVDVLVDDNGELAAGFVDPTPTLDGQGRIVLFFVPGDLNGAIGTCSGGETTCTAVVRSATENDDGDGAAFTLDSGNRAEVAIDTTSDIKTSTDPDIFYDGSRYVLYISHGPSMSVWTSSTLLGSYARVNTLPDGMITWATGGVGSGLYDAAGGQYWTYAHDSGTGVSVIRQAKHADFSAQLSDGSFTIVLTGEDIGLSATAEVASPGIWLRE